MLKRPGCVALVAMVAAGCSAPDDGYGTRDVSRSDFGTAWPFEADSGVLACEPGDVPTFTSGGRTVGLADPDLDGPERNDQATGKAVRQVRDAALDLCS